MFQKYKTIVRENLSFTHMVCKGEAEAQYKEAFQEVTKNKCI